MKVLWLTFIPSPYRLSFFEELGKQCELTVLFERASSKNRKGNWNDFSFRGYDAKILPGITIGGYDRLCLGVGKYLTKKYDHIVISNPTSPTGILAAALLRLKGIPYIVESDGAFPTGRTGGLRQWLKRFVMKPAQYCFSTAKMHDAYYAECGVTGAQLRRYPFTSLAKENILHDIPSEEEKQQLRTALALPEGKLVLSVGRFTHENGYGKGFDVLMQIGEQNPEITICIVGDEPTEEFLRWKQQKNLENVHFVGFKQKEELGKYYRCADAFALATRGDTWGLVINEAMAYGLPVITTDRCVAGLELVADGENGYIVPVGDAGQTAHRIQEVLNDSERCRDMGRNSLGKIRAYTFEEMAASHMRLFSE